MEFAYSLSQSLPLVKKYQVGETMANAGVPVLQDVAGEGGLNLPTTTSLANAVGLTLDTATFVTAQQTDGTSAERTVSVIVQPDAVYRCKLSGGATEDTALALQTVTTASTDGLAVTTAAEWSNPTFDEGVTWGFDGANAGQIRKVTSVSSTAGTVTVAFDQDTVVGDNFLRAPYWFNASDNVQLTTLFTQANAIIAVGTGAAARVIGMILNDNSAEGRTNSFIELILDDHIYGQTT